MSQPSYNMADQNLPNGIPSLETTKQNVFSQEKSHYQYNGIHSAHSSRSTSPLVRLNQIPSSQLPPSRPIPQSQLPPSRSPLTTITQKVGDLSVSSSTPNAPVSKFSTSTPNLQNNTNFGQNSAFSPISSTVPKQSVQSQLNKDLENVPLKDVNSTLDNTYKPAVPLAPSMQNFRQASKTASSFPDQTNLNKQIPQNSVLNQQVHRSAGPSPNMNHQHGQFSQIQHVHSDPGNLSQHFSATHAQPFQQPFQQRSTNPVNPNVPEQERLPTTQNYQNVTQQRPVGVPLQGQYIQAQPPKTTMANVPNQQLSSQTTNISQVQNNPAQMGPPNFQNNPSKTIPTQNSSVPNLNFNANAPMQQQINVASNNNQNYGPYQPPPSTGANTNLYQPVSTTVPHMNYNNKPPTHSTAPQSFATQKANLHSNRYPTPNTSNLNAEQSFPNVQQQNLQQSNQLLYQNRITQTAHTYQQQYPPQQQNAYVTHAQNTYTGQQPYQNPGGVTQAGFNKYWGTESYDLLQNPNILPPTKIDAPRINLGQEVLDQANCSPDIFRCTMTKIPENNSLLQKSRLPLGVLIHPFKDLSHLPVIQCNAIVRCRACRTYINPFVLFVDSKRWKCNLCYRVNELPEEFQYDPVSKTYGDPSRRPEIKSSTIEYIAPAEYMLRPPQPAVYLYLLDVSRLAVESGYLQLVSNILLEELKNLPGDARTQIGFITYDSALHFYSLAEGLSQPHEMTILEIDDVFLPTPDNLLVNLKDRMELVAELLSQLPTRYNNTFDTNSALGAALQVGYKMMSPTGGRVTVFQASLPNVGPGALIVREDPSQRTSAEVTHLNPANDFYKRLALECSGQQIAVDLFIVNSQYVDVATISGISRFSGGCIHHFPLFKSSKALQCQSFERCFRRYLTRKIGFEAVMRIRCTRGLSIHTFHGNFFVRSTDLLSLPNINPDAGFGMQVAIEENLSDVSTICFQAALLYTSSKGERRIRVHTMCVPIASTLHEIIHSADQQCIIGLLSKMAVDRSMQSSLSDAREAFINVAIDILSSYKLALNQSTSSLGLLAPNCLRVLPLFISALLKHTAFRTGTTTRLDDRVKAMIDMKTKPLYILIQQIYPDLYPIHNLENQEIILNCEEEPVSVPPKLHLSARCLDNKGAFLMDTGEQMVILVCPNVPQEFLREALGVADYNNIPDPMYDIPMLDNLRNQRLHHFINYLNEEKPFTATVQVIKDNSPNRVMFLERLVDDRVENALSYHEFLQHLKSQVK